MYYCFQAEYKIYGHKKVAQDIIWGCLLKFFRNLILET